MKSFFLFLFVLPCFVLLGEESRLELQNKKKETLEEFPVFNKKLLDLRQTLSEKFAKAQELFQNQAEEEKFKNLLDEIKGIKQEIRMLEVDHRKKHVQENSTHEEGYAFWGMGEMSLSQLIMEYGGCDFLYVIPQELGSMKIQLFSSIPIPRESWSEMIELILVHNGIGIQKMTPYLRQLYMIKHDLTYVQAIAHDPKELKFLPEHSLVFYVFSSEPEQLRSIFGFFERFSDPKQTAVQIIGNKIVLVAVKEVVERLLDLYEAVWTKDRGKVVRVIHLKKVSSEAAEKILKAFFQDSGIRSKASFYSVGPEEMSVLLQNGSVILVGSLEQVDRGEKILKDLENQTEDPGMMTVFWYTCKHSDPQDLAAVMEKVYFSLIPSNKDETGETLAIEEKSKKGPEEFEEKSSAYQPVLPVEPGVVQPGKISKQEKPKMMGNFIVDPKTGSLLMVVRKEVLPKIQELLKRLDVPKKMAQIEVLLVEKTLHDRKETGVNLLKIGTASNTRQTGINFDTSEKSPLKGILNFILSRPKGSLPAFDLALNFLMGQEDIRINANPSILAVNQTPAKISIVEEVSINNGAIKLDTTGGTTIEKSFSRAQFGITIVLTPTIHLPDPEEEGKKGFITLKTDVTFDTAQLSADDKPPVTRRHIENEVRIADGETIILGGLRRKSGEDVREKIPFLGDIPGVGKLFGTTKMNDHTTEMFVFITPKIIKDPVEDLRDSRKEFLEKRPGDSPEFLEQIEQAKEAERKKLFENSMKMLFDQV